METLSKITLAIWGLFALVVVSVLFVSTIPIYWLWLTLGVVVCTLLVTALRIRRGLVVVSAGAAVVFLATFAMYWIAIAATLYAETPGGAVLSSRLENLLYVIVGNFQQGQILRGLQSLYIQLLMPLSQVVVLIAALALVKRDRTVKAGG